MTSERFFAPMTNDEMTELIGLLGLKNRAGLAAKLRLTENAVQRWFMTGHAPDGPASILMREWLERARDSNPDRNGHGHKNGKRKAAVA